jgi:hypothetical protein
MSVGANGIIHDRSEKDESIARPNMTVLRCCESSDWAGFQHEKQNVSLDFPKYSSKFRDSSTFDRYVCDGIRVIVAHTYLKPSSQLNPTMPTGRPNTFYSSPSCGQV